MRFLTGLFLLVSGLAWAAPPVTERLALWFDASNPKSLLVGKNGEVQAWRSLVGEAVAKPLRVPPKLQPGEGEKPWVTFSNGALLKVDGALAGMKEATVFAAFRRNKPTTPTSKWQKVLSSGQHLDGMLFDLGKEDGEVTARVLRGAFQGLRSKDLWFGTSQPGDWGGLEGELAEVLVYNGTFYVEEPFAKTVAYLEEKWGFEEDRSGDWTRQGPMPVLPERTEKNLPLHDQSNTGGWTPWQPMWDEFAGEALDSQKWWDYNPNWFGRAPGRFLPREVEVKAGSLRLTMQKDPALPVEHFYGENLTYRDFSSGTIKSKERVLYGCFEIEARAMSSAGSSAWWFAGSSWDQQENGIQQIEIDMFELGGKTEGHDRALNMNAHVFRTPKSRRHWNRGGIYKSPVRFDDAFHTYGIEWTPEFIRYFFDGVLVRSLKNTHWHAPMNMIFDSETMFDWLGEPKEEDLPSTFAVRYVRSWKNDATTGEWKERFKPRGGDPRVKRYLEGLEVAKPAAVENKRF